MNEENHMVTGPHFEEPTEQPEPEWDRELYYCEKKEVNHDFPLDVRIKGLLTEIAETDRVPVETTINLLHDLLGHLERQKQMSKSISSLADTVDALTNVMESTTLGRRQG